ncbi:acyltransferase [Methylobacterium sp. J-088]|uniref:acyltransferase family protein n=1 Tax=Methylobacterium sp. J-088 TaxID=2836664 RepID=UPI001FBB0AB2|nr:acyltransferase [Methylobacterium sp. J-088]MCJ2064901.1 acyltransferase [Methylobacterium sp. J-088]
MSVGSIMNLLSPRERQHGSAPIPPAHNNFDYIRLFAATQVVIFHALYHLKIDAPSWTKVLGPFPGVPIFFVVSGFLITASYERSSSLRSYAEKRARRIFPGLWFCLIVTALVLLALGYPLLTRPGLTWFGSQLAALIYTPQFLHSFGFGSYNGSLWTIPVELQFYVTVPLLSLVVQRASNRSAAILAVLAAAIAVGVLIRIWLPTVMGMYDHPESMAEKLVRYSFVAHYYQFALGAAACYLSLHLRWWVRGKVLFWLASLIALNIFTPFSAVTSVAEHIVLGILTLSAAFTLAGPSRMGHVDISYGVYLFHGLILNLFVAFGLVGAPVAFYVLLACSYAAGWVSWTFVESRFLKRGGKSPAPIVSDLRKDDVVALDRR